jgi:hypothetical protein
MQSRAVLFLVGATLVGGFAVGRAAIEHAQASKAGLAGPLVPEYVPPDPVADVISYLIAMTLIGYSIHETPKLIGELRQYAAALE